MAEATALVWIRGPGSGCKAVRCGSARGSIWNFLHRYFQDQVVPVEYFFVKCNGALVDINDAVQDGAVYSLEPRLCGGKGGFGSMLRALGAQIEKTTNREACRDLSGRRLRDVNHEKAMAEWVKQQAEREAEKEQRRLERLQRKLVEPKHCFSSPDYQQQCHEMAERLEDSVLKGMQAASSKMVSAEICEKRKRPNKSTTSREASAQKKKCFWLGVDGLENVEGASSESSDDDGDGAPGTSGMSCQAPQIGRGGGVVAAEFPSGCQRPGVLSLDPGSLEQLQKNSISDSEEDTSGDSCATLGETSPEEQAKRKVAGHTTVIQGDYEDTSGDSCATLGETSPEEQAKRKVAGHTTVIQGDEEAESEEPREKEAAGVRLPEEAKTEERTDGERAAVVASGHKNEGLPCARLEEGQPGHTGIGQRAVDLLAFDSVAEFELLGLDQLKSELTALGLKCGGTLQERAARLFSVRGLAREQIDPALFAKPLKGKKK
ncbi:replication stress response regulator SDE2 isoform X1 [Echinops telfairi]|uniref:Replication stress response regulator SDE2 isoform X1 n=1 Tax=Echinops telfairi TaxID=9371 RepID=A0AC55DR05_ECHTE|nr:replication stress response regulator SDE2 isoform X1 [Echinops telfairi]